MTLRRCITFYCTWGLLSRLSRGSVEATLNACRQVIDELVNNHRGRVFGSAHDPLEAVGIDPTWKCCQCGTMRLQTHCNGEDEVSGQDFRSLT